MGRKRIAIIRMGFTSMMLFFLFVAAAQGNRAGEPRQRGVTAAGEEQLLERRVQNLREQLALTPEQETRVREILTRQQSETAAIQEARRQEAEARRLEQKARLQKHDAEIRALLTEEQKVRYDAMKAERRENVQQRVRERRTGTR